MREITLRYAAECRGCGSELAVGAQAIYERGIGVFCPACAPTDTEQLRKHRQEAADRKAERYEGWAAKRRQRATAVLDQNRALTSDHAFNTQPGHIPIRARVIAQNDRAFESLQVAERFNEKAERLRRRPQVAGDAERRRQLERDAIKAVLKVGMTVDTVFYGTGIVKKINRKTARIGSTGQSRTYSTLVDLSFLRILPDQPT